jgi:mannose-6-phosphate isomerase-like protein (cupin superfamily)
MAPLYFSVRGGAFWTDQVQGTAPGDGIYYELAGSVDLLLDGKTKTLEPGEGMFIPAGAKFRLLSNGTQRPPTYLHFLLSPASAGDIAADENGTAVELYRSSSPVPGLTPERNLLSLSRVPVPPQSPPDPLHRRTGAALHYVLSGAGAEFGEGQATARWPGSISYQPAGYAYQWSNPGLYPLIYLLFNVNPKDEEPVIGIEQNSADVVSRDPHLTWAMYCVAISMILTLVVSSGAIADYRRQKKTGADRDNKWWRK